MTCTCRARECLRTIRAELGPSYVFAAGGVVSAFAKQGDVKAVEAVIGGDMKTANAVPTRQIYHGLLSAQIKAKDLPAAKA